MTALQNAVKTADGVTVNGIAVLPVIDKCEGSEIDRNVLVKAGIVRAADLLVKVLGNGEISRPVTVVAQKFSASAKAKIEAAGGKVVELKAEAAE